MSSNCGLLCDYNPALTLKLQIMQLMLNMPSVLWRCWLGGRKGIRPVKNWVTGCWHGYVSGSRCRFACGPADATAIHISCSSKSRLVLPKN